MTGMCTDDSTHCVRTIEGSVLVRGGLRNRTVAQRYADNLNKTAARMGLHTRYAAHPAIGRPITRPVADPTEEQLA
jgi:hypothetical protein